MKKNTELLRHYQSYEDYLRENPDSSPLASALAKYYIQQGVYDFPIFSTDTKSQHYRRVSKAVNNFTKAIESAHKSAENSQLVFKLAS